MAPSETSTAEHRYLSVLFCDMADSTALVYEMGQEPFAEMLAAYQKLVITCVRRHGGHVARVVGDGVLAYFGWMSASGRDAQAAVRCALDIGTAMPGIRPGSGVTARLAVETGWLLVDQIGVSQGLTADVEHLAAVGLAPHVAARLQQFARPNGVIVGPDTIPMLGTRFIMEPADVTRINLPFAISAAHVIGEAGAGDPLARLRVPLGDRVGIWAARDAELAFLHARWDLAREGNGQVVLLSGEPGMGKSRLLGALLNEIDTERGIVALFCSAPARNTPFQPLEEPLRLALGLPPVADAVDVVARAAEFTRSLGITNERAGVALATLLGVRQSGAEPPAEVRRDILDALLTLADRLARERPLVILAEDVHWADPSTVTLLRQLADHAQDSRILLIITYRSEFVVSWPDRPHVSRLPLGPLAPAIATHLAGQLAAALGVDLDPQQQTAIVARAEGVPLFLEEFVRALAHPSTSNRRLPGSVAQLLTARLDSLGKARAVAQIAAVLGPETPVKLLQACSALADEEFDPIVKSLTDSGVMTRRGSGDEAVLAFRHALLTEAAYEAAPTARRRYLHGHVAEVLSRLSPSIAAHEPEVLARHLAAADRKAEAATLFCSAASKAHSSGAFVESEVLARRALDVAETTAEGDRSRAIVGALVPLGEALIALRGYADPEVQTTFERGARLALDLGTASELLPVLRGLTSYYQVRGPLWMARQLSDRVLQIANVVGDPRLLAQAQRRHGWCRFCQGELPEARSLLETALTYQSSVDASEGELAYDDATTLATLAWLDWLTDGNAAALSRAAKAAARAEASPRPLSAAYTYAFVAIAHQLCADPDGAEHFAERCGSIARDHGIIYFTILADAIGGWCRALRDRSAAGLVRLRTAVTEYNRLHGEILHPYLLGLLAQAEHAVGSDVAALAALDRADAVTVAIGAHFYAPSLLLMRSRMQSRNDALPSLRAARQIAASQNATALASSIDAALVALQASKGASL